MTFVFPMGICPLYIFTEFNHLLLVLYLFSALVYKLHQGILTIVSPDPGIPSVILRSAVNICGISEWLFVIKYLFLYIISKLRVE